MIFWIFNLFSTITSTHVFYCLVLLINFINFCYAFTLPMFLISWKKGKYFLISFVPHKLQKSLKIKQLLNFIKKHPKSFWSSELVKDQLTCRWTWLCQGFIEVFTRSIEIRSFIKFKNYLQTFSCFGLSLGLSPSSMYLGNSVNVPLNPFLLGLLYFHFYVVWLR